MGEELGTLTKMCITMVLVVAIILVVLSIAAISFNFSNSVQHNIAETTARIREVSLNDLSNYGKDWPGATVYLALKRSSDFIASFTLDIDGTIYTNIDDMQNYLGERFYVQTQYDKGYYAVKVSNDV